MQNLVIEEIKKINDDMEELSELLKTVVNDGASIGFTSTGSKESAKYWETVLAPEVILYVAKINNEVAGVFNYISLQSLMGFIELKFVS